MDIQLLRYFCAVAEHGNISKASEALFVSQPALSKAMYKIEEYVGVPLFTRAHRYIALNDAGEAFLSYAEKAIKDIETGISEAHQVSQKASDQVKIACVIDSLLPRIVEHYCFENRGEDIELNQQLMGVDEIRQLLYSGDLSFALTKADITDDYIQWIPCLEDPLCAVKSLDSKLGKNPTISLEELQSEQLMCVSVTNVLESHLRSAFEKSGFSPNIYTEKTPYPNIYPEKGSNAAKKLSSEVVQIIPASRFIGEILRSSFIKYNMSIIDSEDAIFTLGFAKLKSHSFSPAEEKIYAYISEAFQSLSKDVTNLIASISTQA